MSPRLARYRMSRLYPAVRARPAGTLRRVPTPRQDFGSAPEAAPTRGERGRAGVSPQDERAPPIHSRDMPDRASRGDTPARPRAPACTATDPARPPRQGYGTEPGSRPAPRQGHRTATGPRPAPRQGYRRWDVSFRRRTEAFPSA
ncbi:hypothetical protein Snoj_55780 [Streptomyces nojiriensis]|uniref:Uncharacterized protein n=1 Tax=Streptomyces nojiriensis TaxID=66374 RepID=A0ABQ3SU39_9ACTN|nr:hypothetical protein GCM10010205_78240 [Streptomyces nojiriensis]GHI71660.1 hypothetical protein Snoj_55780 [Streptomyces nojiriensis]